MANRRAIIQTWRPLGSARREYIFPMKKTHPPAPLGTSVWLWWWYVILSIGGATTVETAAVALASTTCYYYCFYCSGVWKRARERFMAETFTVFFPTDAAGTCSTKRVANTPLRRRRRLRGDGREVLISHVRTFITYPVGARSIEHTRSRPEKYYLIKTEIIETFIC